MKKKLVILIAIAIISPYILGITIFPLIAKGFNDKELSRMENLILHEFQTEEVHTHNYESSINGERYFMIGDDRNSWHESCIYTTEIQFNEEFDLNFNELSMLLSNFNNKHNNLFEFSFHEHNNSMTISKRVSMPLDHDYVITSLDGNTSTLTLSKWIYPLPFYDSRCKTIMMHNGG